MDLVMITAIVAQDAHNAREFYQKDDVESNELFQIWHHLIYHDY